MTPTNHQLKQREVIDRIALQVSNNSLGFSTVAPIADYENDPRICLTSVHFPHRSLIEQVHSLVEPLREIEPDFFYYPDESLHLTIKNVRVINNPPHFDEGDTQKVQDVFSQIIPQHQQFHIYFYRLLMFPNNLALIGTTDPELDNIILDLDSELKKAGVPDDKVYANEKYFFSNMTLARWNTQPSEIFKKKVVELSANLQFEPYLVDSVSLITGNVVFRNRRDIETWSLRK